MQHFAKTTFALFVVLLASFAAAQTLPTFSHIIIVVQENRTPDNLFGALPIKTGNCTSEDPFERGVDIVSGGYVKGQSLPQCLMSLPLSAWDSALNEITDPDHSFAGWTQDFDSGQQDGFCHTFGATCPEYSFVQRTDVQPYFDIATNYGFANYMFQTSEGPSFPAHQFLFTGTSAPVAPHDSLGYYLDFVAENNPGQNGDNESGCTYINGQYGWPDWSEPTGTEISDPRSSKNECYTHDTLVTNSSGDKITSWRYYSQPNINYIWVAPAAIPEVCYGMNNLNDVGLPCGGTEWSNHVIYPGAVLNGHTYSQGPIFDDLFDCNLPAISWVTPDGAWSDHPQDGKTGNVPVYGPSWVGDIIDAVGGGMTGSTCNGPGSGHYWTTEPTLVLVVWDDWGGWYDHVPPFAALQQNPQIGYQNCNPSSQWGCGYTYGFRVPLLVVSPWTPSGYVSGACSPSGCNNNSFPYRHDFGSILAFVENNFGLPFVDGPPDDGYADYNAPDWGPKRSNIPLSDFFSLPLSQPRSFTNITTPKNFGFFQGYYTNTGSAPSDPDDY